MQRSWRRLQVPPRSKMRPILHPRTLLPPREGPVLDVPPVTRFISRPTTSPTQSAQNVNQGSRVPKIPAASIAATSEPAAPAIASADPRPRRHATPPRQSNHSRCRSRRASGAGGWQEARAGSRRKREFFVLLRRRRVRTIESVRVGVIFLLGGQARKSGATIGDGVAGLGRRKRAQIGVNRLEVGVGHRVIGGP